MNNMSKENLNFLKCKLEEKKSKKEIEFPNLEYPEPVKKFFEQEI